jgi:predicted nuclease of predicted toxin-antitoxin system
LSPRCAISVTMSRLQSLKALPAPLIPILLAACTAEDRVLITLDLDFADIRVYAPGSPRGIWVLRPAEQTFDTILALVLAGVRLCAVERSAGQLWVIDEKRVRIRE